MRVLVVGGAGYLGGSVTDLLQARSIPFTVYDALLYEPHYLKPCDFIRGDVRDYEKLAKVLPNYTHVIWLAALVGDGACAIKPELTKAVNQDSVEWLSAHYNGRIVFFSTCSVYGEHDGMVDENGVTNPLSVYAETKLQAESYLRDKNALIFRLGTAFGISDTYSRPRMDLVVNAMAASAILNGSVTVYGGDQWRPLVHVRDIARATVDNLNRDVTGVYNLATTNTMIYKIAEACAGETICLIKTVPMDKADTRNYRANVDKARKDKILTTARFNTIGDGVREFFTLINSGRILNPSASYYFNVRSVKERIRDGRIS